MRQTMMGLMALMAAMLLSLNVQRASLSAQMRVIDSEMETLAAGVALEVLDYAGSKPFDAATAEGPVADRSQLTPAPFPTGKSYAEAIDLDDFHGILPYTISDFDFDFEIGIEVVYVEEDDPEQEAASQTFAKRITVTVENPHLDQPVSVSHVYAYP